MFLGILRPTEKVAARLEEWVSALWPHFQAHHHTTSGGATWRVWHSRQVGLLKERHHQCNGNFLALEGYITRSADLPRDSAGHRDCFSHFSRDLEAGWPLAERWDGSYAAAFFDDSSEELILAVDPVGLRQLAYARQGDTVVFGNVQAPIAYALGLEPDISGVLQRLSLGRVVGRRSIFRGLVRVLAGEHVRLDRNGHVRETRYDRPWHLDVRPATPDEAARRIEPLLVEQARAIYRGEETTGLAMSGGLDSRLVLGALGSDTAGLKAYVYGDPRDRETRIARDCAKASGAEFRMVSLVGSTFPKANEARLWSLRTEASEYSCWHRMAEVSSQDGVDTLLMGDITNCLGVRIKPYGGRAERLAMTKKRLLRLGLGDGWLPRDPGPDAVEAWAENEVASGLFETTKLARHLGVDVDVEELERDLAKGVEEMLFLVRGSERSPLFQVMERLYIATERDLGGSQVLHLNGTHEVLPPFSIRRIVAAGLNVPLEVRDGRQLLNAIGSRILSPELRKIPTAAIPWVSISAPRLVQEAAWAARFFADKGLLSWHRRFPGHVRRRLFPTLQLLPEYRWAVEAGWGSPYGISGQFSTAYYADRIRRTASSARDPVLPLSELRAFCLDAVLAAAAQGPRTVLESNHELIAT